VPATREAARLERTSYSEGQTGIVTVLQANRALLDAEIELIDARAEADEAAADLRAAAGGQL
jgi:outer membrane protein TolC